MSNSYPEEVLKVFGEIKGPIHFISYKNDTEKGS